MTEGDRRLPKEISSLADGIGTIFKKLCYEGPLRNLGDDALQAGFFKPLRTDSDYPRFHIILTIPTTKPRIVMNSFHIDKAKHNSPIAFLRQTMEGKDQEIKELLKQLGEMEQSAARDGLIELLQSEQLFGNIRETSGPGNSRLFGQIRKRKSAKLKKGSRHRWLEEKNRRLPDEED